MAVGGLLALLDDVTALLDDIAVLSKAATGKTAGIVGDDLALNAGQVVGLAAKREIPVILAVARGSLLNKAILVPGALAISAFLPWAVMPLLMLGGIYLCYEGVEKILHRHAHAAQQHPALAANTDLMALEQGKIKDAIRTDFILSAEIIAITLDSVVAESFAVQLGVLSTIAFIMTVAVYGLVAAIVKLDDLGFHLAARPGASSRWLGDRIVAAAPQLLKIIAVLGMLAMFLVGGGIIAHGLPFVEHGLHDLTAGLLPPDSLWFGVVHALATMAAGVAAGAAALFGLGVLKCGLKCCRVSRPCGMDVSRFLIFLIAGWSGFFVMAVELLSGRLIAPWFGSSIYVWGAIITIFMLALSFGYLLGGRLSLGVPALRKLAMMLILAAASVIPSVLLAESVLSGIFDLIRDPRYGALLASTLLFFVPTMLSGMIAPYAVRLLVQEQSTSGHYAGLSYFVSTIGSAAGTLITSFYLVLYLEVNQILWALTAVSIGIGIAALWFGKHGDA